MKGEAEAFAIEAKAKAEAEQMARKAAAWKQYEDAAVVDMVLEMLPKVPSHFLCFMWQLNKRWFNVAGNGSLAGYVIE